MSNVVSQLQTWFDGLGYTEKVEVYTFLYGNGSFTQGVHLGPPPAFLAKLQEGVNSGQAPVLAKGERCPVCHRPY